jgi:DNA polymerase III delta' subunit
MPLRSIVGQVAAVRTISGAIAGGRVTHAFLFVGPGGVGKRTTALAFAQAMNCPQPAGGDACGVCPVCSRIARGIDIDVRVFSPARMEYRKDEAIEIRKDAYVTPNSGRRKFLILDTADRMNDEAANLLLKTIEEPPEFTVFILLAENTHRILPTIRSRTLAVSFRPLSVEEVLKITGDRISPADARYLYPVAKGNIGTILRLSEDRQLKELFEDIEAELNERLLKSVPASPTRIAEELISLAGRIDYEVSDDDTKSIALRKAIVAVLEVMLAMVERRLVSDAGRNSTGAGADGSLMLCQKECMLLEAVMRTIKSIEGGGQQMLSLEAMAIDFRKIAEGRYKEIITC